MGSKCLAYQASDQMLCECGLQWDMNDPEPPVCNARRVDKIKQLNELEVQMAEIQAEDPHEFETNIDWQQLNERFERLDERLDD